ncbi:PTS fructose transporter subunit IIABC [Ligilactobacillus saerimneri]|uniref:PTS system, fructose-specific IIABC component n=1 Tax=Ligilactobacillus saerimneri 30a TaxID=1227363 RepID=M5J6T1_9LACO|nr:fructose-specific PTS transporter subunit EIIC [Ligilactobacillus saerimneri]EKW99680.1 PTS system, fructose-specific IIABC component [Ligilactobacillus saerimneri 30a]
MKTIRRKNIAIKTVFDITALFKKEALTEVTTSLFNDGIISDQAGFLHDLYYRENELSTYIGHSIGLPHTRSKYVKRPVILVGRLSHDISWDQDHRVNFLVLIAVPETATGSLHLRILAHLSGLLIHDDFREKLVNASPVEAHKMLTRASAKFIHNERRQFFKDKFFSKFFWHYLQQNLMTATGYMIPFIVSGGILYALSIMLAGVDTDPLMSNSITRLLALVGQAGLHLYLPALGGYLAYSMAGRPGLAPGFITALLAVQINSGFIGAIVSGFLVGGTVLGLKRIHLPQPVQSLGPIFLYPLVGTIVPATIILLILGQPIAWFVATMTHYLASLSGTSRIPLGAIIGAMIGSDMGGPINKVAATFCQSQVNTLPFLTGIMGVATATPPLGVGLATLLFKKKFTPAERNNGIAALLMGSCGITEGVLPFIPTNPILIVSACIIGTLTSGALAGFLGVINHAPWGGLIVLPVIGNRLGFLLALLIGATITALIIGLLKKTQTSPKPKRKDFDFEIEVL